MRSKLPGWLALLPLVSACVRLSQPAPALREYRLDYEAPRITGTPLPVTVHVPRFGVAALYDRQPMVYRADPYSMGADPYDRWSVNPGSMVADLLARDLNASGLYRAVQQGLSVLPSDIELNGEIVEIEERQTDRGCSARLQDRVLVVSTRPTTGEPVLLRVTYTEEERCRCNDGRALAEAMSAAQERISTRLQNEMYQAIAGAPTIPSDSRTPEQAPHANPTEHSDEEQ